MPVKRIKDSGVGAAAVAATATLPPIQTGAENKRSEPEPESRGGGTPGGGSGDPSFDTSQPEATSSVPTPADSIPGPSAAALAADDSDYTQPPHVKAKVKVEAGVQGTSPVKRWLAGPSRDQDSEVGTDYRHHVHDARVSIRGCAKFDAFESVEFNLWNQLIPRMS